MGLFKKAVKSESKLRLAIAGPSGSGKTYTSLAIATALADGGGVAVIDSENGSASKYADVFEFDVAEMHAPFSPDKYVSAIAEAANAGYKVIVIDSLTHAWSGTGGLLDIVDQVAKKSQSKNTYMAWKEGTPLQNKLVDAIIQSPVHVIATMRSKAEYVIEPNERGKSAPRKVGMAAIQRDGMEYEFDILFQMTLDNEAIVEKTRCSALTGRVIPQPGADVAEILKAWLSGEAPQAQQTPQAQQPQRQAPNGTQAQQRTTQQPARHTPQPQQAPPPADPFDAIPGADETDNAIAAEAATIAAGLSSPPAAQQWAIEHEYCSNEHHARNRWQLIVKNKFSNKVTQTNVKAAIIAFVMDCLSKPKVQIQKTEQEPVAA